VTPSQESAVADLENQLEVTAQKWARGFLKSKYPELVDQMTTPERLADLFKAEERGRGLEGAAQALIDTASDTFVELRLFEECKLVHQRGHDTHQGFVLPAGEYIRGIREEQSPEGWRRVAD